MEIQRQSDYYSLDRPEVHRASFTAEQIRDMTSGPSIPSGMLNTRTAAFGGDAFTPAPWLVGDEEEEEEDDEEYEAAPQLLPPEFGEAIMRALLRKHLGSTHEASPAALLRLTPMLLGGDDGGGMIEEALGDISGASTKAEMDRAVAAEGY